MREARRGGTHAALCDSAEQQIYPGKHRQRAGDRCPHVPGVLFYYPLTVDFTDKTIRVVPTHAEAARFKAMATPKSTG
jgi:hypothetical protein